MAAQGKIEKIGSHETDDNKLNDKSTAKDFKGSAVEGKKDEADGPVTCETVIAQLRKRKYRI